MSKLIINFTKFKSELFVFFRPPPKSNENVPESAVWQQVLPKFLTYVSSQHRAGENGAPLVLLLGSTGERALLATPNTLVLIDVVSAA